MTDRLLAQWRRAGPVDLTPSGVAKDEQLAELAQQLNQRYYRFSYTSIRFKEQESRWGSYSPRTGSIYISSRLREAPLDLLRYVIIHELCHIRYLNHGPRFWELVARACPDHDRNRRLLRDWSLSRVGRR